jgi:hypothetical protein
MPRRTILLSGACGSGKTSAMRLMRHHLQPLLGKSAVIDVDLVYTMVDPDYSIPFPEAEANWSLARRQCALLARSFFESGFEAVVIGGNSVYQKDRLNEILDTLLEFSEIYHVTLDPNPEEIKQRILSRSHLFDQTKTPEWIDGHVRYMMEYYEDWTARIDNSALSPGETVHAICDAVLSNQGRLFERFSL